MEEEITLEEEQERDLQEQMDIGKSLLYPISRARTVESTGWILREVQRHFIFEINVGMRWIRHRTIPKRNL